MTTRDLEDGILRAKNYVGIHNLVNKLKEKVPLLNDIDDDLYVYRDVRFNTKLNKYVYDPHMNGGKPIPLNDAKNYILNLIPTI